MRRLLLLLLLAPLCAHAAQFTLSWQDNSSNEQNFRIERAPGLNATSGFTEIATVGANIVTYVDAGLPNNTSYSYRLRAWNSAGFSGYSNTASGTTPPPLNTAPTISDITNKTVVENGNTGLIAFAVGDAETSASLLTVSATSSNTTLVPVANISFGGSGNTRTIIVTPLPNQIGTSTITITVSDGNTTASDSFVLTVTALPLNAPQNLTIEAVP
jgi:hypothetical protein